MCKYQCLKCGQELYVPRSFQCRFCGSAKLRVVCRTKPVIYKTEKLAIPELRDN